MLGYTRSYCIQNAETESSRGTYVYTYLYTTYVYTYVLMYTYLQVSLGLHYLKKKERRWRNIGADIAILSALEQMRHKSVAQNFFSISFQ